MLSEHACVHLLSDLHARLPDFERTRRFIKAALEVEEILRDGRLPDRSSEHEKQAGEWLKNRMFDCRNGTMAAWQSDIFANIKCSADRLLAQRSNDRKERCLELKRDKMSSYRRK